MGRWYGPQLSSLIYDMALVADRVMRPEVADYHQGQGRDCSSNRPDRFVHPKQPTSAELPCGGRRP
jgi:hypothetical protein